jgi:hypothetical protein
MTRRDFPTDGNRLAHGYGCIPGYYEFLDGGPYDPGDIGEQQIITALGRIATKELRRSMRRGGPTLEIPVDVQRSVKYVPDQR